MSSDITNRAGRGAAVDPPNGGRYIRYGPTGKVYNEVKPLDAAARLPDAWVRHFGSRPKARTKASASAPKKLTDADVLDAVAGMAAGDPCPPVAEHRHQALADCDGASARARHDAVVGGTKNHVMWLVRRGEEGHKGVPGALEDLRVRFVAAVAPDRSKGAKQAAAEFDRALKGAVKQVYADPTADADKGCCGPRPGATRPIRAKQGPRARGPRSRHRRSSTTTSGTGRGSWPTCRACP